jgi:hypothetical protein
MNLPMTVGSAPQLPALWDEDEAPALAGGLGLKRAMAICGGLFWCCSRLPRSCRWAAR